VAPISSGRGGGSPYGPGGPSLASASNGISGGGYGAGGGGSWAAGAAQNGSAGKGAYLLLEELS
jgi:hypothetical protein